jgi:prepilin peptidase CpaA
MNIWIFVLVLIQLTIVAWIDLKRKTISNRWHFLNLVMAMGLYAWNVDPFLFKWQVLLLPLGYVLFGFLMFLVGIMGAGDSKYLASLNLIIPLEFHLPFFESLLTCTIFLGTGIFLFRVFRDRQRLYAYVWARHWQGIKEAIKSEFSYAPVFFLAWMLLGAKIWI